MSGSANTFARTGDVWKPRFKVFVGEDGVRKADNPANIDVTAVALSVLVQKQNWYQADRHQIVLSLWESDKFGYQFWSHFQSMSVLVQIGFEQNGSTDFEEVFRGFVDKVIIDPIKGTVTLAGRNVLNLLVDFKEISFDTSKSIKEILDRVSEETKVPIDTSQVTKVDLGTLYGRFWPTNEERTRGSQGHNSSMNPNDIFSQISREYGLMYYEENGTVFFKDEAVEGETGIIAIAPEPIYELPGLTKLSPSNCTSLSIEHDLNISQWDWYVVATNYDHAGEGEGNQSVYPEANKDSEFGKAQHVQSANRKKEDNDTLAKSQFTEFTLHEWLVTAKFSGPQILGLKLNNLLEVRGTGTVIDGPYIIDMIEHQVSFERGYVGTVRARWGAGAAGQTGEGESGP